MARALFDAGRRSLVSALAAVVLSGADLSAQLIQIKTLPIADADQWRFFPSANLGMGAVSIALSDSLLDPFVNPAMGARAGARGLFFGSPTFYSVSENAGGGRTLPLGGIVSRGNTFAGIALALQEVDRPAGVNDGIIFPTVAVTAPGTGFAPTPTTATPTTPTSRQNRFAFGTLGRSFPKLNASVGASVLWSGLHSIDGVDQMFSGAQRVAQSGNALDVRVGVTKEWDGARTLQVIGVRNHFSMTDDVTWLDQVWDPNKRTFAQQQRLDQNLDRTETWGLHAAYAQLLADSGWRVGATLTSNLMSHPKLPDYRIQQVSVIPWDPGHSAAFDLGLGVSKSLGPTTFGVDAIYEPILSHTWGESQGATTTASGATVPDGGMTTENRFRFSNAILRAGVGQDIPLATRTTALRIQLGVDLRSIAYTLDQTDHIAETTRRQDESWLEWTRTWGLTLRFTDLELRYVGRSTTGNGRPGVVGGGPRVAFAAGDASGPNILAAPNGPLTLTDVSVVTHQVFVSLPIR